MNGLASDTAISQLLNEFSVPMFAVDRATSADEFRISCLNDALERSGGRPASEVIGKSIYDLLPEAEADIASLRYAECAHTRKTLRFRERFTTRNRLVEWDTTLQYVALANGRDRVIGTTFEVHSEDTSLASTTAFEDIQYFSSMADIQLRNLIGMFDDVRGNPLFQSENDLRIAKLNGMCRSVQRSVEDIQNAARSAHALRQAMTGSAEKPARSRPEQSRAIGSDTLWAIIETSNDMIRQAG